MIGLATFKGWPYRNAIGPTRSFNYSIEPQVIRARKLTYFNKTKSQEIDVPISSCPVFIGDNLIVASDDGYVQLFDKDLENILWKKRVLGSPYAPLMIHGNPPHVLITTTNGIVASYSLKGELAWETKLQSGILGTPLEITSGVLAITQHNGYLFFLSGETGSLISSVYLPCSGKWPMRSISLVRDPYSSPISGTQGVIIARGSDVFSINSENFEIQWKAELGGLQKATLAYDPKTRLIFAANCDGSLYILDESSGEVVDVISFGEKMISSPAIINGVLVFSSLGGKLRGLDILKRNILWVRDSSVEGYTSIVPINNSKVCFINRRASLECVDISSGCFYWETSEVLGIPDHDSKVDTTPVFSKGGLVVSTSYSGYICLYEFGEANAATESSR